MTSSLLNEWKLIFWKGVSSVIREIFVYQYMKLNYPVNTSYNRNFKEYFSYLPDIGHDCSGYGETIEQSLENLKVQQRNIFRDYLEIGRRIPKPYSKGNTEYV